MIRVWRQIKAVDNDGRQLSGSYLFDSDSRLVEVRDRLGGVKCASASNGPVAHDPGEHMRSFNEMATTKTTETTAHAAWERSARAPGDSTRPTGRCVGP